MPRKKHSSDKKDRPDSSLHATADATVGAVRSHVLYLLRGGGAHAGFEEVVAGIPAGFRGAKPPGAAHTPWQVIEHMRIAQWDILEFSRNPRHISPEFPTGYWPEGESPADEDAWQRSIRSFRADLEAMQALISDPCSDLFATIRHPDAREEHTLLREALLLADHNSYHLGGLVLLRRLLGAWPR